MPSMQTVVKLLASLGVNELFSSVILPESPHICEHAHDSIANL